MSTLDRVEFHFTDGKQIKMKGPPADRLWALAREYVDGKFEDEDEDEDDAPRPLDGIGELLVHVQRLALRVEKVEDAVSSLDEQVTTLCVGEDT